MMACFILFTYIYSCILRKREHCLDNKILKDRKYPDYLINQFASSEIAEQNETTKVHNEDVEIIDLTDDQPECKRLKYDLSQTDCTKYVKNDTIVNTVLNKHLSEELIDTKIEKIISLYNEFDSVNLKGICQKFISGDMDSLNEIIQLFYKKLVPKSYLKKYLSRIKFLAKTYNLLNTKGKNFLKDKYSFKLFEMKLREILEKLVTTFGSTKDFSQKEYDQFVVQLEENLSKIEGFNDFKTNLITILPENKKILYFYELIKCAKYFVSFPELMSLGGIETCNSINSVIFTSHLINLLLTGRKYVEEVKTIVLFLIKQSFSNTCSNGLDFFSFDMLKIKCWINSKKIHEKNFYFFLWEMNNKRRQDLRIKLRDRTVLSGTNADEIHFNSVLLIFLYQQIIFLRINDVNEDIIEKYTNLIDDIFSLRKRCAGCFYDKFLELLRESYK